MLDYLEPKIIKCAVCETEFDANSRNRGRGTHKYCSPKCRQIMDNRRHYRRRNPPKTEQELKRACVICETVFVTDAHHPNALTCSVKCNQARMDRVRREARPNKDVPQRACEECGELYAPNFHQAHRQKYCSKRCQNRVMQKRRRRSEGYNRRYTTTAWKAVAKAVLNRDNHKCRICNGVGGRLHVHHLFYRTEDEQHDDAAEGLLTLCNSCHGKIHDIRFGKDGDEFVISGLVFDWLGIDKVRIVDGCSRQTPS